MSQVGRQQDVKSRMIHIPNGDAGIARTIQFMRLAALQGAKNPQIRGLALNIVSNVASRDSKGEIQALYDWVKQNIKFRGEYEETIQTPEVTLRFRAGDCDDHAILLSALLGSIGYETRFKTVAVRNSRDLTHVYCEVRDRRSGTWIALDTTVSQAFPSWQPPDISRARTWPNLGDSEPGIAKAINAAAPLINAIADVNIAKFYAKNGSAATGQLNIQRTPGGVSVTGFSANTLPSWAWTAAIAAGALGVGMALASRRSARTHR